MIINEEQTADIYGDECVGVKSRRVDDMSGYSRRTSP